MIPKRIIGDTSDGLALKGMLSGGRFSPQGLPCS